MRLEDVRTLRSHPVAFDQCRDLIHSLEVKCIPSSSTSDAAREVAESEEPSRGRALEPRGRRPPRADGDRRGRRRPPRRLHALRRDRAVHACRPQAPAGGLRSRSSPTISRARCYHALGPFHRHGLNLVQLVSRPIPRSTFRYRFDMVLDGHPLDDEVQTALVEMRAVDARGQDLRQLQRDGGAVSARTLFDKIWEAHVVDEQPGRAGAALHRPAPRPRGDEPRRRSSRCASRGAGSGGPT